MLGRIEASSEAQARSESRLRRFVADAAHELRSPLTSVRGYAELYRQGAFTDPEEVTRAMDRIEGEGIRMKRLLDEMLLLARLDQKVEQVREPVDLSAVAREATDAFAVIQPGRPLSVEIEDGVVVEGDAVHVRQVIDNLLTNIRVHTPPDARAEVSLRLHDGAAELRVRDEGPGIDPAFLPHLFERFTREDPARTRLTGGSGLGMAIVAALVESMDGSIRAESEPGAGTTFVVRLPTSQPVNT
jgi:two-component system OmpR family sensor kinase